MALLIVFRVFNIQPGRWHLISERREDGMNQQLEPSAARAYDDEIDLMELVVIVWRARWLLMAVTVLVIIIAAAYVQSKPSVYHLEAQVSHPNSFQEAELGVLTLNPTEDDLYLPQEVFATTQRELVSRATQREFVLWVNQRLVKGQQPMVFDWFANTLKVEAEVRGKAATGVYLVSLVCVDEERCSGLVNDYVDFVHDKARQALVSDMLEFLASKSQRLVGSIDLLRENHKLVVADKLVVLDTQIEIAREVGWATPVVEVLASDKKVPRYYAGYRLLESVRAQLLLQLESDAHISGLRGLQQRLESFESAKRRISGIGGDVSVLNIVDYAYPTNVPVSSNKKLILAVAALLGGMLGLIAVFISHSIKSYRKTTVAV